MMLPGVRPLLDGVNPLPSPTLLPLLPGGRPVGFDFTPVVVLQAGDGIRTRDLLLGKQMLYQLRYSRSREAVKSIATVAGPLGSRAGAR
jgi:hypothetical protein